MKMNIDKSFKKSLEDHEMAYDSKAWDALSKKLDKTMPTGGSGSNWKWYIGGAAVVAIAVTSYLFVNNGETHATSKTEVAQTEKIEESMNSEESTNERSSSNSSISTNNKDEKSDNTSNSATSKTEITQDNSTITQIGQQNQVGDNSNLQKQSNPPKQPVSNATTTVNKVVVLPEIDNLCKGEKVKIENKNDVAFYIIDASGEKTVVKAKNSIQFEAKEEGKHTISYFEDGKLEKQSSFTVLTGPSSIDMSYDNINIFDEGLPTISMQTGSTGSQFEWKFESIKTLAYGREVEAHFFKKGNYNVTLTVTGSNGCKASETMNVHYPEDYNLMATMSFNPNSSKDVNRTFLPEALRLRNTPFRMIIIDPSNGATIFETSDIGNPWTGIDSRNGQLVEYNKSYAWKVILSQPVDGERSEYAGPVVMSTNR